MAYIELTESNFNEMVEKNETLIIDFWAEWCGPCIQFGPVFEKVAQQNPDITFGKINTEVEQGLAGHFQVQSIPTIMVIKEGVVLFQQAGAFDEAGFNSLVSQTRDVDMEQVKADIAAQQEQQENS
jgi:thioredoxin 1